MQLKVNDTVRVSYHYCLAPVKEQKGTLTELLDAQLKPCGPDDCPIYGTVVFPERIRSRTGIPSITCHLKYLTKTRKTDTMTDLRYLSGHLEASIADLEEKKGLVERDLDGSLTAIEDGDDPANLLTVAVNAYDQAKAALSILLAETHREILHIKAEREANGTECPHCHGAGEVLRTRSCAEDDAPDPANPDDYDQCPFCYGIGYLNIITDTEGED